MKIIEDPSGFIPLITGAIQKYGYAPEHNVDWFLFYGDVGQMPVFASWPDGTGVMVKKGSHTWNLFSEPLAPQWRRGKRVAELAEDILQDEQVKKIEIEARTDTREEILKALPAHLMADSVDYTLTWPVMDMDAFDPMLPGGHFKRMRKTRNKFYDEHVVEIVDATTVDKNILHGVVDRWEAALKEKNVPAIRPHQYHNIINGDFRGTKTARAMLVDTVLVGFNAGWEVPNSNIFYTAVGIHDYSFSDIGSILYVEDLVWLKNHGYKMVDTGGVDEGGPLEFKNKFLPVSYYQTHVFPIVRK